jgi:hypothetical protein
MEHIHTPVLLGSFVGYPIVCALGRKANGPRFKAFTQSYGKKPTSEQNATADGETGRGTKRAKC